MEQTSRLLQNSWTSISLYRDFLHSGNRRYRKSPKEYLIETIAIGMYHRRLIHWRLLHYLSDLDLVFQSATVIDSLNHRGFDF